MEKRKELYAGKAKSIYTTDDPSKMIMLFRDDTSAFDGEKTAQLNRKGMVNNKFNAAIMTKLAAAGIPTHFETLVSDNESLVKNLAMLPVECVVRNRAAGSLVRRLGVKEGETLNPPTYELFLKDDALHDPMVNTSLCVSFGWATEVQLEKMEALTLQVNEVLFALFDAAGMVLVDYKLEFGVFNDQIILGDEFSPDGCRIWDKETNKKMDKDRFRQGLGSVIETYEEVGARLGITFD